MYCFDTAAHMLQCFLLHFGCCSIGSTLSAMSTCIDLLAGQCDRNNVSVLPTSMQLCHMITGSGSCGCVGAANPSYA